MKVSSIHGQEGFSALGLFFLGLALIILMGASGFFIVPKSPNTDKTIYKASNSPKSDASSLHLIDLKFESPTPIPIIPITPTPTVYILPAPTGNYCKRDTIKLGNCDCPPDERTGLFCGGSLPPAYPICFQDQPNCDSSKSKDPTCVYYCYGKPVIYLYPLVPTYVNVSIVTPGDIVESIPTYPTDGWQNVLALPGGILKYQNNYYRELYYESSQDKVSPPDNGVFINTQNLELELKTQTIKLGLSHIESNEFVDYWLPRLQKLNKPYIFFSIISKQEKERTDHVEIYPKPDTFIQFIAYFKGVDKKFQTKPFAFPQVPNRTGFTAVEWGGVIEP